MRILLVNDDGIDAPGIWALYDEFCNEHEVIVCAPLRQRSGFSHSISLGGTMTARRVQRGGARAFAVDGTPADCAIMGLGALAGGKVDLVISGINDGYNAAMDVHYSGTMGAAAEACMQGVNALAVSTHGGNTDYAPTLRYTRKAIDMVMAGLPCGCFLSLNVPMGEPKDLAEADTGALDRHTKIEFTGEQDGVLTYNAGGFYSPCAPGSDRDMLNKGYAIYTVIDTNWTHNHE